MMPFGCNKTVSDRSTDPLATHGRTIQNRNGSASPLVSGHEADMPDWPLRANSPYRAILIAVESRAETTDSRVETTIRGWDGSRVCWSRDVRHHGGGADVSLYDLQSRHKRQPGRRGRTRRRIRPTGR